VSAPTDLSNNTCFHMPILGENQGNFEDFKTTPENRGARWNKGKEASKQRKTITEKSSYKVDKLLQSSWKVDKHRLGERLDRGPTKIKSRRKWTNLIHLGLGFL
jgi:hypothetical protein